MNESNKRISQISSRFSIEQDEAINKITLPPRFHIMNAGTFETKLIVTEDPIWYITASGRSFKLNFFGDPVTAKLLKFLCIRYCTRNSASKLDTFLWANKILFKRIKTVDAATIIDYLKSPLGGKRFGVEEEALFYLLLFTLKQLIAYSLPGFTGDYDFAIELLPRPTKNTFLVYQDIENVLTYSETTMIQNGLVKYASQISSLSDNELCDLCLLGLSYSTGIRPVQIAKLEPKHLQLDFGSADKQQTAKFSLRIHLAKQGKASHDKFVLIKLSEELAFLLSAYITRRKIGQESQLFQSANTVSLVNSAIRNALKLICPPETQQLIDKGELIPPAITSTDFRHNLGHTLAMRGASAEEIAYILGHSSTVAARHYILATPELADIKARTLGINPVYQDIIAMMITGEVTKHERWKSDIVAGSVNCNFHIGIGGCAKNGEPCHLSPVRACYGCQDFHPFADADHISVLNDVQAELEQLSTLSDATGAPRSPIVAIHEQTKFEVISVIARCKLYKDGEDESRY